MSMHKEIKPKRRIDRLIAIIRKDRKDPIRLESWRYWSIMDALQWYGVCRQDASDIAKWCGRAHEELTKVIGDVSIELVEERGKKQNGKDISSTLDRVPD